MVNWEKLDKLTNVLEFVFVFFFGIMFAYLLIGFNKSHIISDMEYTNYKTLEYKENLCSAYYDYFNNAEALLDSVKIEDSPYIETDKGSEYINSVKAVKDLQDQEENCDKY